MKEKIILSIFLFLILIWNLITIINADLYSIQINDLEVMIFSLINFIMVFSVIILILSSVYIIWFKSKHNYKINAINMAVCCVAFCWHCFFLLGCTIALDSNTHGYDPISLIGIFIINILISQTICSTKSKVTTCPKCHNIKNKNAKFCSRCGHKF